ncbi:hypothetical protein BDZ97DRAFT_2071910 [Flammula alnicola]|nr:hypothetical protein BDZ97DRAFT_2071910 [Flammula alnicola]
MQSVLSFPSTDISLPVAAIPAAEKENASLKQTALQTTGMKGKKRTLTLVNGEELDLTSTISQATPQIVEAMRLRILQLENEISSQPPPAKRAKTTASAPTAAGPSASSEAGPSSTKAEEKKHKMQVKKIFDQLKKECKSDNVKFQGSPKTIKFDEIWEQADFEALFKGKGVLIQPTPENKPKSAVTIIQFNTQSQISAFFGDELKALKGNVWSRGGNVTRRMGGGFGGLFGGGGSTFTKSIKQGACDVQIQSFEVNYSKNNLKCTIKFEVAEIGGRSGGYGYDDW